MPGGCSMSVSTASRAHVDPPIVGRCIGHGVDLGSVLRQHRPIGWA